MTTATDAGAVLALINKRLRRLGRSPLILTEAQSQSAYASLRAYAASGGRTLEQAIDDMIRFQIQTETLQRSN